MTETVNPTYGNWSKPTQPGLWRLGLPGTALLFVGLLITILAGMASIWLALTSFTLTIIFLLPIIVVDKWGRNGYAMIKEEWTWFLHKRSGRNIYQTGPLATAPIIGCELPGVSAQISCGEAVDGLNREFAILHHNATGNTTVVIACEPQGLGLIDDEDINQQVALWGKWLADLQDEEALEGMSVTFNTTPDTGVSLKNSVKSRIDETAPEFSLRVMGEIADNFPVGSANSVCLLALTWSNKLLGRKRTLNETVADIAASLPELTNSLETTGAGPCQPLNRLEITRFIRKCFNPETASDLEENETELEWSQAGPSQAVEEKDYYLHDDGVSVSWFMGHPPKGMVHSNVLTNIFAPHKDVTTKRVTLLFRPFTSAEAARLADSQVLNTTHAVNQQKNEKARSWRKVEQAAQTASEQASGAGLIRFSMIVTVTTNNTENLDRVTSIVEHSGTASKIRLRKAYRCQATTFVAGLPLGLVLPTHVKSLKVDDYV